MKIYRVGGCVRDKLLGTPIQDQDFVVVGASEQDMLSMGFHQVGKDFPVFLHPETAEEYALARKERKNGPGYHGFLCETHDVTLEEDLFRRDLTINAMAMDNHGNLIDPFHGQSDLKNKILRHVSVHFKEDPVRILRIARFAARYGFSVAPETKIFLKEMVQEGLCNELSSERVWKEFEKVLNEPFPQNFIQVLEECGAWNKLNGPLRQAHEAINKIERFQQLTQRDIHERQLDTLLCMIKDGPEKEIETHLREFKVPSYFIRKVKIIRAFEKKSLDEMSASDWLDWIRQTKALHQIKESTQDLMDLIRWQSIHTNRESIENRLDWISSFLECTEKMKSLDLKSIAQKKNHDSVPIGSLIINEQMKLIESWLSDVKIKKTQSQSFKM